MMSFICLGLDSAYIRFFHEPPSNTNNKQLAGKCMSITFTAFTMASFIIIILRNHPTTNLMIGGSGSLFVFSFLIMVFAQLINRFMTIFFRMSSDILNFFIISITFVLLTRTIFIPTYYITPKFESNIILMSLFWTTFILIFFLFQKKNMIETDYSPHAKYTSVYRYAFFSSPEIVILCLNTYIPQLVISQKLGDNILGIYSAALLFCLAIQVLCSGFTTFWAPFMFKNYKTASITIKNVHDVVLLCSILILSLILIFNDFFYLFVGESFRRYQNILGMLLIHPIAIILVETTAYGIAIKKKNEISLLIYTISTVTNILLCLILSPKYGLAGIAFASMIAGICHMLLMTYFGQKFYQSINNIAKTIFHVIALVVSAILFYFLYDNLILFIFLEIGITTLCFIYNKSAILWCIKVIRKG